jgi:tRNA threonylcarbamoyl adenosine modification protein (Sua5/YciO/YrdC/YwlC family)
VAPGAAREAALLALRVLALASSVLRKEIEIYRQTLVNELDGRQAKLVEAAESEAAAPPPRLKTARPQAPAPRPEPPRAPDDTAASHYTEPEEEDRPAAEADQEEGQVSPANLDRPLGGKPAPPRPPAVPPASPARVLGRLRVEPDAPAVEVIEEAIDCLLEGGVIAFPTETVYGLAADATNPAAVERLYELKGRPRGKSVTLMVDSPKLLGHIACNLTVEARRLMEAFWPGPLTIVFQKRGDNFSHVSPEETIGVRLPDHSVPLAIVQALARPLVCTSANLAGQPECFTADEVERAFGGRINLILDGGELADNPPSTVIDVTREPYRILRQGAVTREQIAADRKSVV